MDNAVCTPWVSLEQLRDSCPTATGLPDSVVWQAAQVASEWLYVATNRQWGGLCPRIVRPRVDCKCPNPAGLLGRVGGWQLWPGGWQQQTPGRGSPCCRPARLSKCDLKALRLPGPVNRVTRVTVNGMDVPLGSFIIQGRSTVLRIDGESWPCSNDLGRDPADPASEGDCGDDAWEIEYEWGLTPPASGSLMALELACELMLRLLGSDQCRLPSNITRIWRDGVTFTFADPMKAAMDNGLTGIQEIDQWIVFARGGKWRPRKPTVRRADGPRRQGLWVPTGPDC